MDTVSIASKLIGVVLGALIAFISWFIKGEMGQIADTLKSIQSDVEIVKKDAALTQQEMKLELKYVRRDIDSIKQHFKGHRHQKKQ